MSQEEKLKDLWARTDSRVRSLEQEIVDTFMGFLREVAKHLVFPAR